MTASYAIALPSSQSDGIRFTALPPLSLYIHLPWCIRKCPYCDFNSHQGGSGKDWQQGLANEQRYVDALLADLDRQLALVWGRSLTSIFIGGGTPSLFSPDAIARLLSEIRARFRMPGIEITMEANPSTFEYDRFQAFRDAGVNRLSIGIQSFHGPHLQALGRIHGEQEAHRACEIAADLFSRFNLDLMTVLPQQTLDQAVRDVQQALAYKPPHLSLYHLTLEPGTAFAARPPLLPDDDTADAIDDATRSLLLDAGFERYEVSAYGRRLTDTVYEYCQHNLNYWQFGDYLGIGAGAHGKISLPDRIIRTQVVKQPDHYMDEALGAGQHQEQHQLDFSALPFEFMLNALRLRAGVPTSLYAERCGRPQTDIARTVSRLVDDGLMVSDPTKLQTTERGYRFLNHVLEAFLA